jgi:hypothetical protein
LEGSLVCVIFKSLIKPKILESARRDHGTDTFYSSTRDKNKVTK